LGTHSEERNGMNRVLNFTAYLCVLSALLGFPLTAISEMETFSDIEAEIDTCTGLIGDKPDEAEYYIRRGDAYFKLHRFDAAVEDYTTAIELDNALDQAYFGRGLALGRQGFIREGIADLSEFIRRNPENSLAYTKRGVRYLWLDDRDRAEKDLTKAVELDPDNAEAHDDLGVVLSKRGDYEQAIGHFMATTSLDPGYQKGYHNLAMVLFIIGQDVSALAAVNQALDLSPEYRDSLLLKSKILEAMGKPEEAALIREDAEFLPQGNWSERVPLQ
jgi:tetratricopeptide (TPR) repeat protein